MNHNYPRTEFLANMSHEFRTPLNGILGYPQILKRENNLTTQQDGQIEIIEYGGHHPRSRKTLKVWSVSEELS